jgi:uncharacterized membrane protein
MRLLGKIMMTLFDEFLLNTKYAIECIGVLVIIIGAIRSIFQLMGQVKHRHFAPNYVRLDFGNSVILGLEFMVGADIIGSLIQPDYYNLGMLAIIVLIRTVLSYFLNQELSELTPKQKDTIS